MEIISDTNPSDGGNLSEVEQRIFELQEMLLDASPTEVPDILRECQVLFQPHHYAEVVEERSVERMCGNPACINPIKYHAKLKGCSIVSPEGTQLGLGQILGEEISYHFGSHTGF